MDAKFRAGLRDHERERLTPPENRPCSEYCTCDACCPRLEDAAGPICDRGICDGSGWLLAPRMDGRASHCPCLSPPQRFQKGLNDGV